MRQVSLSLKRRLFGSQHAVFRMARHYLGCKRGTISIREKRIDKAKRLLRNALDHPCNSGQELAAMVGSIICQ